MALNIYLYIFFYDLCVSRIAKIGGFMKFQADVKRWVQALGRLVVTNAKRSKTPDVDVEQTKANTLGQKRVRRWVAAGAVAVVAGAGIAFAAGEN